MPGDIMNNEQYTGLNTVVVAIKAVVLRGIAVNGFEKHNAVFDFYKEPSCVLDLLSVPCFLRVIDVATYQLIEQDIVNLYSSSTPQAPMLVYGTMSEEPIRLPTILFLPAASAYECKHLYDRARRRAKYAAKKQGHCHVQPTP